MDWTQFAGLTVLEDGESVTADGGSFLTRNPLITDRLLRVGAVTHRHDGSAGLLDPEAPPTAVAVASGGSIPARASYALTYTLVDANGGETLAAVPYTLSTTAGVATPAAPLAVADYTQGILPAGDYYYALTITDGVGGETDIGPSVLVTIDPGHASGAVDLSGLADELHPSGPGVNWRLWRSYEGEDWHLAAQGAGSTFTDTGFDPPDNPSLPPADNSTGNIWSIVVTLPTIEEEPAIAFATAINLYLAGDVGFANPCYVGQYPVASAGASFVLRSDAVTQGSPPHASTSTGGAHKIYPETELIFGLKTPVPTFTMLPAGPYGDARITLDDAVLWAVLIPEGASTPDDWTAISGASGIASGGHGGGGSGGGELAYAETDVAVTVGATMTTLLELPPVGSGDAIAMLHLDVPEIAASGALAYARVEVVDDLGNVLGAELTPGNGDLAEDWYVGGFAMDVRLPTASGRTYTVQALVPSASGTVTFSALHDSLGGTQPIWAHIVSLAGTGTGWQGPAGPAGPAGPRGVPGSEGPPGSGGGTGGWAGEYVQGADYSAGQIVHDPGTDGVFIAILDSPGGIGLDILAGSGGVDPDAISSLSFWVIDGSDALWDSGAGRLQLTLSAADEGLAFFDNAPLVNADGALMGDTFQGQGLAGLDLTLVLEGSLVGTMAVMLSAVNEDFVSGPYDTTSFAAFDGIALLIASGAVSWIHGETVLATHEVTSSENRHEWRISISAEIRTVELTEREHGKFGGAWDSKEFFYTFSVVRDDGFTLATLPINWGFDSNRQYWLGIGATNIANGIQAIDGVDAKQTSLGWRQIG